MKRGLIVFIVCLFCILIVAGKILGWGRTEVRVTRNVFTPNQVWIDSGDSVYFENQTGHGAIVLCLGKKGMCASHASGPAALQNGGVILEVDELLPIEFSDQGSYMVTSPQHVTMTLVVTVTENSGSSFGGTGSGGYSGGGGDGGDGGGGD